MGFRIHGLGLRDVTRYYPSSGASNGRENERSKGNLGLHSGYILSSNSRTGHWGLVRFLRRCTTRSTHDR